MRVAALFLSSDGQKRIVPIIDIVLPKPCLKGEYSYVGEGTQLTHIICK